MSQESPLLTWLRELQSTTEVESLSALQSKSIASTPESFEALSIRNAQVAIQQVRSQSSALIDDLDSLIDSLPVTTDQGLEYLYGLFYQTYQRIYSVIEICRRKGCDFNGANRNISHQVIHVCEQTLQLLCVIQGDYYHVNNAQIEASIRKLKEIFGELVDVTIRKECSILVNSLGKKSSPLCIKWSLLALWQLTQKDPYMCRLFIEQPFIITSLLDIVQNFCASGSQSELSQIKTAGFRVLTYLCSNSEALEAIRGEIIARKCLTSIVKAEQDEAVLKEIVALLVQLTTPFIDAKRDDTADVNELVQCLTSVARSTGSQQIFLMACAALANITFINTDALIHNDTLSVVVNASKQRPELDTVLLKDQVITLLANACQKHPLEIVSSGGLMLLLNTLVHDHSVEADPTALIRIQQKIAVAIARLASNKSTARIIHRLHGVAKLVQLCKDSKMRLHSDTVLLASIAALKRISHSIGREPFEHLNATDLIDLKLQSSFYHYSAPRNAVGTKSLV